MIWVGLPVLLQADGFPHTLDWARRLGNRPVTTIAVTDSLTILAQLDGHLTAVRSATGGQVWSQRPGGPVGQALIAGEQLIYFADRFGQVGALRPSDGTSVWQFRRQGWGKCHLLQIDDVLLVVAGDQLLYGLDARTGAQRWRLRTGLSSPPNPVEVAGRVVVASTDGVLLRIRPEDGQRLSRWLLPAMPDHLQMTTAGLLALGAGWVRLLSTTTGDILWERWLGTSFLAPAHVQTGGSLRLVGANGWLYQLQLADGSFLASAPLPAAPVSQAGYGDEQLVVAEDGWVRAYDHSLHETWSMSIGAPWELSVAGPHLFAAAASRILAFLQTPTQETGTWWEISRWGERSGYRRTVASTRDDSLFEQEETVAWRAGFVRRTTLVVSHPQTLRPYRYHSRRIEENQILETEAHLKDDQFAIRRTLTTVAGGDSTTATDTVAWKEGDRLSEQLLQTRPARDEPRTVGVVDLLTGTRHEAVVRRLPSTDRKMDVWEVDYHPEDYHPETDAPGGVEVPSLHVAFDMKGEPQRMEIPGLSYELHHTAASVARRWRPTTRRRGPRLKYALAHPQRLDTLRLRVPSGFPWSAVESQPLPSEAADPTFRILTLARQRLPDAPPHRIPPPEARAALRPSLFVQSANDRIRSLSRQILADISAEEQPVVAARRLHDWVHDHMVPLDTNVRFKSALEVLQDMEGTCSEYTVLYLALARAAGIPARATVGYALSVQGSLVLHIWPQVYLLGSWLQIDPSWDAFPVGASHIPTGQGLLTPSGLASLNLPLEILSQRADTLFVERAVGAFGEEGMERVFLGEGETLWQDALVADGAGQIERMRERLYEIALLPTHHRTADALIRLGRSHLELQQTEEAQWALERLLRLSVPGHRKAEASYFLGKLAFTRGDDVTAQTMLKRVADEYPTSRLADDALALLAEWATASEGCQAAEPFYLQILERYSHSGWADVARGALRRCAHED